MRLFIRLLAVFNSLRGCKSGIVKRVLTEVK
jgi:hypothetical protein